MSDDRAGDSGSPQDRYYQRYAGSTAPGDELPTGSRSPKGWWWALAAGVVVLALVILAYVVFGGNGSDSTSVSTGAGTGSSSSSASPTSTQPSSQSSSGAADGGIPVRPVVPGWQGVGGVVRGALKIYAAYDAPPNWTVKQPLLIYYNTATGSGVFGKHSAWGLSEINYGKCAAHPNNSQANASFVNIGKRDPA